MKLAVLSRCLETEPVVRSCIAMGDSSAGALVRGVAETELTRMTRKHVEGARGPVALGPYSPAVWAGDLLYLSGQTPIDPKTGDLISGGRGAETRRRPGPPERATTDPGPAPGCPSKPAGGCPPPTSCTARHGPHPTARGPR